MCSVVEEPLVTFEANIRMIYLRSFPVNQLQIETS